MTPQKLLLLLSITLFCACKTNRPIGQVKNSIEADYCNQIINQPGNKNFDTLVLKLSEGQEMNFSSLNEKTILTRNVISILINYKGDILLRGEPIKKENLNKKVRMMYVNESNRENYSDYRTVMINNKELDISNGIIAINKDDKLKREVYIEIVKQIFEVLNEYKNNISIQAFGKSLNEVGNEELQELDRVFTACPVRISNRVNLPPPPPPPGSKSG